MRYILSAITCLICCQAIIASSSFPPTEQQMVLIVEGSSDSYSNSFSALKRNFKNVHFDIKQYASHDAYGAGNNVQLNISNLNYYELVFISMQQGTLARTDLLELAKYVKEGGRLYIMYGSNPRNSYLESMEKNTNDLLAYLGLTDQVRYKDVDIQGLVYGTLKQIDNNKRLENNSRASLKRIEHSVNKSVGSYKSTIRSGHCFATNSRLDESELMLEFNSSKSRYVTSAFWNVGYGLLGIGTESHNSAEAQSATYHSWEAIWDALNIDVDMHLDDRLYYGATMSNDLNDETSPVTETDNYYLQEELSRAAVLNQIAEDKKQLQAQFDQYQEQEQAKLDAYKTANYQEQNRLKRELAQTVQLNERSLETKDSTHDPTKSLRSIYDELNSKDEYIFNHNHLEENHFAYNQLLMNYGSDYNSLNNLTKLDKINEAIKSNDYSKLIIEAHHGSETSNVKNLNKAIDIAEELKYFLVRNGVPAFKISVNAFGRDLQMDNQCVIYIVEENLLTGRFIKHSGELLSSTKYDLYQKRLEGLSFRVLIGSNKILSDEEMSNLPLVYIEQNGRQRIHQYVSGQFKSYQQAERYANAVKSDKFKNPRIIAYLEGVPLDIYQVEEMRHLYPELEPMLKSR